MTRNICSSTNTLRKSVIKVIFVDWFKILTRLKFNSKPPELFFRVFFLIFFWGANGVPFDLVLHQNHLSLVVTYWQPLYFRFFQSPSFLFSHKFCTTEFWAGFWWRWFCGIYGSSSLSQPPFLSCLSFSQSTVWYRRSSFSGRNIWSIASSWLQSSSFQQQSSFRFGSRSICYSRRCFSKLSSSSSMKTFGLKSHNWFLPLFARVLCAFSSVYHVSIAYSLSLIVYHLYQLQHTTTQIYVCFVLVLRLFFRIFCFMRFFR